MGGLNAAEIFAVCRAVSVFHVCDAVVEFYHGDHCVDVVQRVKYVFYHVVGNVWPRAVVDKNEFGSYAFKGAFHGVGAGAAAQNHGYVFVSVEKRARAGKILVVHRDDYFFKTGKSKKGQYGIFKHRTAVYRAEEFVEVA